ncbi:MAG: DUF134 domain-containing protein [Sphaerochaetaceae bacterium]
MPRPRKWRMVCCMPTNTSFGPLGVPFDAHDTISMSVDEYEAIRLIDLEGCTQEECATQMHVARTTVQGIYESARKKLAQSLVNGKALYIEGGEYRLCDGQDVGCRRGGCCRYRFAQLLQDDQKKSE